ncbi:ATP-binding cassette domain-containing protein [Enterococcus saccharolyticus]|uniref:Cell division ATP-binding protein FtsE n=1 Tax=Candidatus Enterococcus willemsii TaxID=1857215 RepID=A0ABQ6YWN2_9ENTE|nr:MULTISPECIES: ATP-binding cassette domain-containing protein [Enterococcus]KAF1302025.1 cell division ATP-binding protein FtsE [Enterococcus sp. CU12B]MCD5002867.1 ATP-binding cassette domain-containing protein [Enterococcus saccharolyticus]
MIKVKNATKRYNKTAKPAVKDISFQMKSGEFIYLIGPSGSGKSTLLKLLSKEVTLTQGSIQVDNIRVEKINTSKLYVLRRKLGVVSQEDIFLPQQTVYQNVIFALQAVETNYQQIKERATAVLSQVGMLEYSEQLIENLSIGQRKKVAIARALVNQPLLLIADEPTANLDVKSAVEMMKLFLRINEMGTSVMIATHDSTMVNSIRKRVIELSNGEIVRDDKFGGYTRFSDPKDVYVW